MLICKFFPYLFPFKNEYNQMDQMILIINYLQEINTKH